VKRRIVVSRLTASLVGLLLSVCISAFSRVPPAKQAQDQSKRQEIGKEHKRREKQLKKELDAHYKAWLNKDVVYIITPEERRTFLRLTSDEARDKFIERFWEVRNPSPGSPVNTYKEEIYRRIAYANANFGTGSGTDGWRTARGQTYITLGPPQQTDRHRVSANLVPIEIWFYSNTEYPFLPPFFYVMFYQRESFGDYRFYSPYMDGPDKLVSGMNAINDPVSALKLIGDSLGPEVERISLSLLPDEPVDEATARASLESDVMLSEIRNLAGQPFYRDEIERRRGLLQSVTSRLIVEGRNLDIVTLPVRDSRGLTRLDYAIRLRNPSDLTLSKGADGRYTYSIEVRVRVFGPDNKLIFTQQRPVSDTIDKQRLSEIRYKVFGYEGTLPLPPGKYHLDFLFTDWQKQLALHAERNVVIPSVNRDSFVIPGVIAFSTAETLDPGLADLTPFSLAGVKFTPLASAPLVFSPEQNLQVAYQIWAPPKDPRAYADQKLEVEYALGQPAASGGAAVVKKDEISMEQFSPTGSLVNGEKLPLNHESMGSYMLTVAVDQPGTLARGFATLSFTVLGSSLTAAPWDIIDPSIVKDAEKGVLDQQRGLCYLAEGRADEARVWFRRALARSHSNDAARASLVSAYYAQKDYAAVVSLFKDAGITDETDSETIIRIADSLQKTGEIKKSISLLEGALQSRPEDGPLYLALGDYYGQVGDAEKAAKLTRKGMSIMGPHTSNR
jgi:GWxTD domain-containing protein